MQADGAPSSEVSASTPWLSVILPTHNGEAWIEATLASLAAQTVRGFECIVIDSSVTAETLAIVERFRDRLVLRTEYRADLLDWQGKTNRGAEMASATHLCMLHQDDLWAPTRAQHVATWISEAPDVDLHLHPCWIVDDTGSRLGRWRCPLPSDHILLGAMVRKRLLVQNFVAICAPVIRRDRYLEVGGLDRALWYTADWDLYLKLVGSGTVVYHREALASYRIHSSALTISGSRRKDDFEDQLRRVLDRHSPAMEEPGCSRLLARAKTSIAINVALARTLHSAPGRLVGALLSTLRLGPVGMIVLLRDTRLVERVLPRLRLHVAGRLKA